MNILEIRRLLHLQPNIAQPRDEATNELTGQPLWQAGGTIRRSVPEWPFGSCRWIKYRPLLERHHRRSRARFVRA